MPATCPSHEMAPFRHNNKEARMSLTSMELDDHVYDFSIDTEYFGERRTWHLTGVETRRGLYLFDVGGPGDEDVLEAALEADGFALADIEKIVLTHQDLDHLGCVAAVSERSGGEVVSHTVAAPYVAGERPRIKRTESKYDPVPVDLQLIDGVRFLTAIGEFEAIFTPGHAPGHLVFYCEAAELLIAGDLLRSDGGFSGPKPEVTPDMAETRRSIGRLLDLDIERICCFHGGPVEGADVDVQRVYDDLAEYG